MKHDISQPSHADFLALSLDGDKIIHDIKHANNWQEKYRHIMLCGKYLPKLDQSLHTATAQVRGCESNAWLYHAYTNEQHYFIADSDSRIVKGLMTLLLAACNGKTSAELVAFEAQQFFADLGLAGQLSPSRTNGLYALVEKIKACV